MEFCVPIQKCSTRTHDDRRDKYGKYRRDAFGDLSCSIIRRRLLHRRLFTMADDGDKVLRHVESHAPGRRLRP